LRPLAALGQHRTTLVVLVEVEMVEATGCRRRGS
jgi:hypothetical protein